MAHFERRSELNGELRAAYAAALGCDPGEVALTTCTSEGIAQIIGGLDLGPGDEILTSDEEHPGLLGALAGARDVKGVTVRMAPLARYRRRGRPTHDAPGGLLARRLDERTRCAGRAGAAGGSGAARRRSGRRRDPGGRPCAGLRRLRGRGPEVDVRSRRHGDAVRQRASCGSGWGSSAAAMRTSPTPTPAWTPTLTRTRARWTRCR